MALVAVTFVGSRVATLGFMPSGITVMTVIAGDVPKETHKPLLLPAAFCAWATYLYVLPASSPLRITLTSLVPVPVCVVADLQWKKLGELVKSQEQKSTVVGRPSGLTFALSFADVCVMSVAERVVTLGGSGADVAGTEVNGTTDSMIPAVVVKDMQSP